MKRTITTFVRLIALPFWIFSFAGQTQTHAIAVGVNTVSQDPPCFSIHVRLNGTRIAGPQAITLKTNQSETTASLEGGCFKLAPALLTEKVLDVSFTVPGSKVYLSGIAVGFFAGPWDIDLADQKFSSEVPLPKHARVKEACAVVFHVGEPERALVQTGCRTSDP